MPGFGHELRSITSAHALTGPTKWQRYRHDCDLRGKRSVYVIQLSNWKNRSPMGSLYVGQTGQTLSARFDQHQSGSPLGAKGLAGHCWRFREELYLDLPLFSSEPEAREAEWARATKLRSAGFAVECNNAKYRDPGRNHRDLFGAEELAALPTQLQQLLVTTMDVAEAPDQQVVHALRWCRDPGYGDPPPTMFPVDWIGRLAHMKESVVADLVVRSRDQ